MPEILVPNLSGSKHFDPGFAPTEKWPGLDPSIFRKGCSFFGLTDWADFGVIRSGIVQLDFLPYKIFWSRASLTRYGPPNSKMVIFGCFLDFWTNKKYANGKIEDIHFQALSTSFNLIPNLSGLDRAPLSYDPLTVPGSENFFSKQIYVVRPRNDKIKK